MELKWWQRPVRMMRRDFLGDFSYYQNNDLEEMARIAKEQWHINCEWIMATPGCAPGQAHLTTFNSDKFAKIAGLGNFDIIREYLPHARKYGIHLVPYINQHWYSYEFAKEHPEFAEQELEDGTAYGSKTPLYGNGTTFCVNSPWREFAFEIIRETIRIGVDGCFLDGPVIFPRGCYCKHCRKLFKANYGFDRLPSWGDWSDEAWKPFLKFRRDSWRDFMRDAQQAVIEVNPEAIIFLNGGNFNSGSVMTARDVAALEPYQNFNGSEEFFHCSESYNSPFKTLNLGRFLAASSNPSVVFTHHTMSSWHYVPLSKTEMTLAITQAVASGSNTWLAIYMDAMQYRAGEAFAANDIQQLFAANETLFTATESAATTALVTSANTLYSYISDINELTADVGSGVEENLVADLGSGKLRETVNERRAISEATLNHELNGAFDSANFGHIPLKALWDQHITPEKLQSLSTLILPNTACLSDSQCKTIMDFVHQGGSLLASFEAGFYNEDGDKAPRPEWLTMLGIKNINGAFIPAASEEYMLLYGDKLPELPDQQYLMPRTFNAIKLKPLDSAIILGHFMNTIGGAYGKPSGVSKYPALISSNYGKGKVIYSPGAIFESFNKFHLEDHLNLVKSSLRLLDKDSTLQIETTAPGSLAMELRYNQNNALLHLINTTGDMKRPIGQIIPLTKIDITLKLANEPTMVKAINAQKTIDFSYCAGKVTFSVEEIADYELISFEFN